MAGTSPVLTGMRKRNWNSWEWAKETWRERNQWLINWWYACVRLKIAERKEPCTSIAHASDTVEAKPRPGTHYRPLYWNLFCRLLVVSASAVTMESLVKREETIQTELTRNPPQKRWSQCCKHWTQNPIMQCSYQSRDTAQVCTDEED